VDQGVRAACAGDKKKGGLTALFSNPPGTSYFFFAPACCSGQ
jgi:hypothetical protein